MNPKELFQRSICDFHYQIKDELCLFNEKVDSVFDENPTIEQFVERILDKKYSTLSEFISYNEHKGAPRNIKITALLLMGTQYIDIAHEYGLSVSRTRRIVHNTVKKFMPHLDGLSVGALRSWRIPLMKKMVELFVYTTHPLY